MVQVVSSYTEPISLSRTERAGQWYWSCPPILSPFSISRTESRTVVLVLSSYTEPIYLSRTESRTVGVVLVLWAAVLFSCLPLLPAHGIKSNVSFSTEMASRRLKRPPAG